MAEKCVRAPFTKGINLTNWLEYRPMDEVQTDYYTEQDFLNVKKLGCDVIRLPIHFEKLCREEDGYAIPDRLLKLLDRAVSWAQACELYLILDFHNATHADSRTSDDVEKILDPVWTQLAQHYVHASDFVVYEIMNEPHGIAVPIWNEIISRVHALIRGIDLTHYVIVGGADWNSAEAMRSLPAFEDDRLIYTFHCYDPHTFTHQGAGWCHMERIRGIPFPYDEEKMPPLPENATEQEKDCFERYPSEGTLEAVQSSFERYAAFSQERNAPVFCGEFGCNAFAVDKPQRTEWYRLITALLEEKGIARASWDYYGTFGIFDIDWSKGFSPRKMHKPRFPEDLDRELLEAMGLNVPCKENMLQKK